MKQTQQGPEGSPGVVIGRDGERRVLVHEALTFHADGALGRLMTTDDELEDELVGVMTLHPAFPVTG